MANDFHDRFKQNVNQYRSSYSHIPNNNSINFNINLPFKLQPSQPQYQYSNSFNDHLTITNTHSNNTHRPSTPICSDTDEYDEYDTDFDINDKTTSHNNNNNNNNNNNKNNKWYMAFPDTNTNTINNISRSEPHNTSESQHTEKNNINIYLAKTKIFNPINGHINKPKNQLYREGINNQCTNNTHTDDECEFDGYPITIMGYTNNYDNEGKSYHDKNNIQQKIHVGITLMGNIQTNDNNSDLDMDENINMDMNMAINKGNITLMGDANLEGKLIQFEIKNNNINPLQPQNIQRVTLMGYCNQDQHISFNKHC